jgi:hypothetical protein
MIVGVLAIGLAGAADGVGEGASAFTSQFNDHPANSGLERKQSGDPYFAPDERADPPPTAGYAGDPMMGETHGLAAAAPVGELPCDTSPVVSPFLDSGQLHSGSYVFVRSGTRMEDEQLLELLGLDAYHPTSALVDCQRYVVIGNSPDWTVIGDDWEWAKFHSPSVATVLSRLVSSAEEVLFCVLPDVDLGFEFSYWRDGVLVRSFEKVSHDWGRAYVVAETGARLSAETEPIDMPGDEATKRVWAIARSLDFDLADSLDTYRVFAGPSTEHHIGLGAGLTNMPREIFDNPRLGPHLVWRGD